MRMIHLRSNRLRTLFRFEESEMNIPASKSVGMEKHGRNAKVLV